MSKASDMLVHIKKHPGISRRELLRAAGFTSLDRPTLDLLVDSGQAIRHLNAGDTAIYVRGAEPTIAERDANGYKVRRRRRTATENAQSAQAVRDLPQTLVALNARLEALELIVEALTSLSST